MYTKSCLSARVMSAGANDPELLIVSVMHVNIVITMLLYFIGHHPLTKIFLIVFYIASNHTFLIILYF